jgi:hypothetical protein
MTVTILYLVELTNSLMVNHFFDLTLIYNTLTHTLHNYI